MDKLQNEALDKAQKLHDAIEESESLCDVLIKYDAWHQFREVMIRLSLS